MHSKAIYIKLQSIVMIVASVEFSYCNLNQCVGPSSMIKYTCKLLVSASYLKHTRGSFFPRKHLVVTVNH